MKKLFKLIFFGVTSFLILAIVVVLILSSSFGENYMKDWLENQLTEEIGLSVSIKEFHTNIWSYIKIDTLTIDSIIDMEHTPYLYIGEIQLEYSLLDLLGENISLNGLYIDSVVLGVVLDNHGHYGIPLIDNLTPTTKDSSESGGLLVIDSISLSRINLSYLDTQVPISLDLTDATLYAQINSKNEFSGHLFVGNIITMYDSLFIDSKNLEMNTTIGRDIFQIDNLKVDCEGLQVEGLGNIFITDNNIMDFTVSISGPLDTLTSIISKTFDIPSLKAGELNANLQISGNLENPSIQVNTDIESLSIQNINVQSAHLQGEYQNNKLMIDTFQALTLDGEISGNAVLLQDSLGISSLNIQVDDIALPSIWMGLYTEDSPYKGSISGSFTAQGKGFDLSSWKADATTVGKNLSYLNQPIPELKCIAKLESSRSRFSFIHGVDTIAANLEFVDDSIHGTFLISAPDITALAQFVNQSDISGGIWGNGTIGGTYINPIVSSNINGSKILYRNFPVDTFTTEISYNDSNLTVIDFTCEGRIDSIDAKHPVLGIDSIAGSGIYECELSGSLDNLKGILGVQLDKPRYGSYTVDSISLTAKINGSEFSVSEFEANLGETSLKLKSNYDTLTSSGSFDIQLYSSLNVLDSSIEKSNNSFKEKDDIGRIDGEFTIISGSDISATVLGNDISFGILNMFTKDTVEIGGEFNFDLKINGSYLNPIATLKSTAYSVKLPNYFVDSLSTYLRLTHDVLIVDSLTSYAAEHTLKANGQIELFDSSNFIKIEDSSTVIAELRTTDFNLTAFEGFLPSGSEIAGTVSASLSMSGTLATPQFGGWLNVVNGKIVSEKDAMPIDDINISLLFSDSIFKISSATCSISDIKLNGAGSITTSTYESASVDMNVNIDQYGKFALNGIVSDTNINLKMLSDSLNLTLLQPFMTGSDSLNGIIDGSMQIVGELAMPFIDGSLRVRALSFNAPKNNINLSKGYSIIRFDKNRVIIDSLFCSLNGGTVLGTGFISHEKGEIVDADLKFQANSLTFQKEGFYNIVIDSSDLSYRRQQENYVLDGDIVLGETRLTAGFRPTSILPWTQSFEAVDFDFPEMIRLSRLNVRIRESEKLWIDNNLARIRLRANLGIIGTPIRPNFTGLIKVEEGYLLYLDRRFLVNEGTVYFNDPTRFNPNIKLDASTEITVYKRTVPQVYNIFIKADGLMDQLQYGLYSEPSLEKPDIVALLTLGATRAELSTGDSNGGLTGVLKDRATSLTSKRVSGFLSKKAGSFFGFDEFTIQGNLFQFDDTWGPQLVASKRISKKVVVTYSTLVGHLNDQTVQLGYSLTSHFSLQGETNRQGRAGLDFKYGLKFK